ncbi:MAG: hypothetical protein HZA80_01935 [Candidatus Taylorbacteria bacterium]|nr:hypothetical protein [Candidatus Taylorbacteria bacterium]
MNIQPTLNSADITLIKGLFDDFEIRFEKKIDVLIDTKLDARFEEFALMVARGFEDTNGRIDNFYKEFVEFKEYTIYRFDGLERRIDDLSITRVKYEDHRALEKRVRKLEHKLS